MARSVAAAAVAVAASLAVLLALSASHVCADNNNIRVDVGDFHVEVTGNQNVPKYSFWRSSDDSGDDDKSGKDKGKGSSGGGGADRARVKFGSLYECEGGEFTDSCKIGTSQLALASLSWSFDGPHAQEGGGFNFTLSSPQNARFSWLELINYVGEGKECRNNNSADADCPKNDALRFDVIIRDYVWVSSASDTLLVLDFSADDGSDSALELSAADNATWTNANGDEQSVSASLESKNDGKSKHYSLVYQHGSGTLVHDPEIAVTDKSGLSTWAIIGIVVASVVCVGILCAAGFLVRRRMHHRHHRGAGLLNH